MANIKSFIGKLNDTDNSTALSASDKAKEFSRLATAFAAEAAADSSVPSAAGSDAAPPRDPDQSSETHKDTDYWHSADGSGYYTFPGFIERSAKPSERYSDAPFSEEDKMTQQYIASSGKDTRKPYADLSAKFTPSQVAELGQMFGSSGDGRFYNPYAGSLMGFLASGGTVEQAKARFATFKNDEQTDGAKDSQAQITDAWFEQAAATVAKYA